MPEIPVYTEQGGSVLRAESGGSIQTEAGARVELGTDATTATTAYTLFKMGNNSFYYVPSCANSPILAASPGDLLWMGGANGSPGLYQNVSHDDGGSVWLAFGKAAAGSEIPAGP